MEITVIPDLIKAGDNSIGLGPTMSPPKVDCRVWAEDQYELIVKILEEVRKKDIESYINGESPLLPLELRQVLHTFLQLNNK